MIECVFGVRRNGTGREALKSRERPVPLLRTGAARLPQRPMASANRGSNADARHCTTAFKNAHGTIFRELLYPWHPWFAHRVAVHEAIGKPNEVVFRCTLSGSDAGRSVEIPAWMFDRTVCAAVRLTAAPHVNAAALSALRDLLWHALWDPSASSSEPVSGVSRTSPDQNRRQAHACQQKGMPDQAGEPSAGPRAAARPVWRRSPQGIVATPMWRELPLETRVTLTGLMVQLIRGHAGANRSGSPREADHDL